MSVGAASVLAALAMPSTARAQEQGAEEEAEAEAEAAIREFDASLRYQTGAIQLPCGKAALALPDGYRYLGAEDTDRVLQMWGNPPSPSTEGMIVPPGMGVLEDNSWAVVLEYTDDGHVDDADAASIDYDALLSQMKQASAEENRERKRLGLATAELLGWAEPPHYDQVSKKRYWAKDLAFSGDAENTLNYAVRILGREGVLELNAVARTRELATVKPAMNEMLGFSDFTAGNRYADYQPGVDRDAGYGVATLVAGGAVATKIVTSKGFWALLLAAKKFLIVIALAIGGAFKVLWSRLRGAGSNTQSA